MAQSTQSQSGPATWRINAVDKMQVTDLESNGLMGQGKPSRQMLMLHYNSIAGNELAVLPSQPLSPALACPELRPSVAQH